MPPEFGRDVDRLLVLELRRELDADEADAPDAAAELADAVTALRLATAGAIAAGPVVFERLDYRPLRISPLLPIAATQPRGEATRLDKVRGAARGRPPREAACSPTTTASSARRSTAGSSRSSPRSRSALRRSARRSPACSAARTGAWAASMRAAVLLGDKPADRADVLESLRAERLRRRRARRGAAGARRDAPPRRPRGSRRHARRDAARRAAAARLRLARRLTARASSGADRTGADATVRRRCTSVTWRSTSTGRRLPSGRWTKHRAVLERLRRIEELEQPSSGGRALASDARALLDELRALVPEAEAWARAEGDARARSLRETSRGGGRNAVGGTEMALVDGSCRLLPRPMSAPCAAASPCGHSR